MKDTPRPTNLKTEIRLSPGKGRGVFATKPIKKGEIVEVAPTLQVPKSDMMLLKASFLCNYLFADDIDEEADLLALGHASMYNHASDPNAEWITGNGLIFIRAIKAVKGGEELTLDYGWEDEDFKLLGINQ